MSTPRRVLILTAGFGEGHNAAARALAQAFEEAAPGSPVVVDLLAQVKPRLNQVMRKAYLGMINGFPKAWSRIYKWMDETTVLPKWASSGGAERRALTRLIEEHKPVAICSTFPIYAFILERLARDGVVIPPVYNIVTDSISINSLWWRAHCDGWFVPNEDSADFMRKAGVPAQKLHVLGFPVNLFFVRNAGELCPPDLSAGAHPRILYIINSGTAHADVMASLLIAETHWEITCAVGRDETLRKQLETMARGRALPATILGWTDQIPRLLMTHHIVVSKAGGATTQEAIAARCPMVVNQVVPGQEEGNYELLRRHNAGVLATKPELVMSALRGAFDWKGKIWGDWRLALGDLARPEAARSIASHVLTAAEHPPQPALHS